MLRAAAPSEILLIDPLHFKAGTLGRFTPEVWDVTVDNGGYDVLRIWVLRS